MADDQFVKGFRTQACYFPESTYGTYSMDGSTTKVRRIGGKVRGATWTVRQNIMQTGNIGDGRNYKLQIFGQYDASANINFEVVEPSFLRFAIGDIAKWAASGTASTAPYFFVESELTGVDGSGASNTLLKGSDSSAYTNIRLRPFSMMLYDIENTSAGTDWNDSVDQLKGCVINDFTLTASIGTPLVCTANILVREISYRKKLAAASIPDWTSIQTGTTDSELGTGDADVITPVKSYELSTRAPLMFFNGSVTYGGNALGQVTSFSYSYNNQLLSYRQIGSRFIELPQTGMRRQTLSATVIFRIPKGTDGNPSASTTNIVEIIKNYLGYASDATFVTATELRPALATTALTTSPQQTIVIEKDVVLSFSTSEGVSSTARAMTLTIHNVSPEGFGVPVTLENGLIEIPVTFSVRGYPFARIGEGTYGGHDGAGVALSDYHPIVQWWYTY